MSQQPASSPPAAKYGKSSEFGQILDFIQSIVSDEALRHEFDIPHLVVVGRQNMAKTTLINRLIGRYLLPMRKGETATHLQALTTYPIILNLRTSDKYSVTIKIHNQPDKDKSMENFNEEVVEKYLRDVAKALPKEPGTCISKTPVTVTLHGPDLSNLTLVDLPGVQFANDDDRMNIVTQNLVLDYIKKNNKSIIVIVSQVGDPTGDGAINMVMKYAQDYKRRTICVLTKPDKHNQSDDIGRKVATNKSNFTLEDNHFILLRGKDGTDPNECEWDAETTRVREQQWFAGHKQYQDLLHLCGIDRLMETMIKLLSDSMIVEIPKLVNKMKFRKEELERELKQLSVSAVPEDEAGKGKLMASLQFNLIKQLKTLLFNNVTTATGGENVRKRILQFNAEILEVNPLSDRSDEGIIKLLRKLEGVSAPLGHSSESSQLLERLLYEEFTTITKGFLGGTLTLPSPVDILTKICQKLVEDVEKELKSIVSTAVGQSLQEFPDLRKAVEVSVVNSIFNEKQAETMNFIKQFIQMQKKSVDVLGVTMLMPEEIEQAIESLVDKQRVIASNQGAFFVAAASTPTPTPNAELFVQLKHLSTRLHSKELIKAVTTCALEKYTYKDKNQLIKTKKNVVRCFNTIKLNVIDTVPRCIQHFFIAELVESLKEALESNDKMEFLQEKEDVRIQRAQCQKTLDGINHNLPQTEEIINMLLRIKRGRSARLAQ